MSGHRWATIVPFFLVLIACSLLPAEDEAASRTYRTGDGVRFRVQVVAENLEIPWAMTFAPDGRLFVAERPGRVCVIEKGSLRVQPVAVIREVEHVGEGGLMGLALDPKFPENHFLYLAYTYRHQNREENRIVRYQEDSGRLVNPSVILDNIPGARFHDGGRIRFGPDGKLYITTGDATQRALAQDIRSLAGKVLRLSADGTIPVDNPFGHSPVYSYGHRNPQGMDFHPLTRLLFGTEHGPSGFDGPGDGDEVNIVEAGKNYGWPVIHHRQSKDGLVSPLLEFTPAIAPAGGSFYRGNRIPQFKNNFFFGALRGEQMHRVVLKPPEYRAVQAHEPLLAGVFGRIRDVVDGPDGALYFCTSNRDGRGRPHKNDDRIFRIVAAP
ncbi:MAG: PQQ-dependent sugar dehydrogenase [Acidobacteria bacterium]|nr:PQQ-dependent sugar dehydrogenase [Acidobacteriota bacterium]